MTIKNKETNNKLTLEKINQLEVDGILQFFDKKKDKRKLLLIKYEFVKRILPIWEDWAFNNAKEYLKAPRELIELTKKEEDTKNIKFLVQSIDNAKIAKIEWLFSSQKAWRTWAAAAACEASCMKDVEDTAICAAMSVYWNAKANRENAKIAKIKEMEEQKKIIFKYF